MDRRRVGQWILLAGALTAWGTATYLAVQHGLQTMPPMVPVFLALATIVTVTGFLGRANLTGIGALAYLALATAFGLSTGFMIWGALVQAVGFFVAWPPFRPIPQNPEYS